MVLQQLLISIREWKERAEEIRKSAVLRDHTILLPKERALAVIGVRRCGKTWAAIQCAYQVSEKVLYYNFEDPLFLGGGSTHSLDELLTLYKEEYGHSPEVIVLDEIQNVNGWERWVRKQIDLNRYQIIVTGSSSRMLSTELATSLTGRVKVLNLWPLSFKEVLDFEKKTHSDLLSEFGRYLKWGGFPKVVHTQEENERVDLLQQYLYDIISKDVVARNEIRNRKALDQLVGWYFNNASCLHSYSSIQKAFDIPTRTSSDLTRFLNEAFLVFEVNRYHLNLKVQTRDPKKVYVIDMGMRNVIIRADRMDRGRQTENAVFLELCRRKSEISYFKGKGEVDFVLTHLGKPLQAIQVCDANLENEATEKREINSLLECLKTLKLREGLILTRNLRETRKFEGYTIQCLPVHEWIMRDGS